MDLLGFFAFLNIRRDIVVLALDPDLYRNSMQTTMLGKCSRV